VKGRNFREAKRGRTVQSKVRSSVYKSQAGSQSRAGKRGDGSFSVDERGGTLGEKVGKAL